MFRIKSKSKKKKNKQAAGSNNNGPQMGGAVVIGPSPFRVNICQRRFVVRYTTALAGGFNVNVAALAWIIVVKSSASTDFGVMAMFEAVRLRELRLYAAAGVASSPGATALGLEFTPFIPGGSSVAQGINTSRINNTTTSVTGSAMIYRKPSKDSFVGGWLNPSTMPLATFAGLAFNGTAPVGSVLDVILEVVVSDGTYPATYTTSSSISAGVYALGLDGLSGSLKPQDYTVYY